MTRLSQLTTPLLNSSNEHMVVGLPIDGSDNNGDSAGSLATRASEAQLQARISTLREQLQAATEALQNIHTENENDDDITKNDAVISATAKWNSANISKLLQDNVTTNPAPPVSKRGYLFKWLDRSIGWSGTKWALRFVHLDGHRGIISYYGSHLDAQARYVLSLRGCAVRDDGWKRNQRHKRKTEEADPPLEEPGAYFFIFSIYQRLDNDLNESDIVPLLRFSTPSMAEKLQWIQVISEACAYCETEQWQAEETERAAELAKQQRQQSLMSTAMPEAKEGTLPPLYFAPMQKKNQHKRRPSFTKAPSAASFRTKSENADAEKSDTKSTRGYPPGKPMHRSAAASYLSAEAPVQNYRGFFNLGVLILLLSNFRLLVSSVRAHGFVVNQALLHYIRDLPHIRRDPWEEFPFVSGFLLQGVFIAAAFCIEWLLSRERIPVSAGMFLHQFNAHAALGIPIWIVWHFIDKPAIGAVLLLHATITWMKLLSYILANEDYRTNQKQDALALVENLDPADVDIRYPENVTMSNMIYYWFCPSLTYQIAFPKTPRRRWLKIGMILLRMAICVSLFMFVAAQVVGPSLAALVRDLEETGGKFVCGVCSHLLESGRWLRGMIFNLNIARLEILFAGTYTARMLAEYWLKLSIANTYLWLLMFYFYFHLYLNLFAELLRFGDRVFYKDWWNSAEVSAYWRLWNQPVHYWLIRHVYFPCLRHKFNKTAATFTVFLLSAIMHEALVSVPFHMVRPWSFVGMMMQMPLVAVTKFLYRKYPGRSIGNMIFWLSFCVVGQPMAILLYTVDYRYAQERAQLNMAADGAIAVEQCRVVLGDTCMIR